MNTGKVLSLLALSTTLVSIPIFSQTSAGSKPSFEVASVKPNTSGGGGTIGGETGRRFVATGVSLRMLMTQGYRVRDFRISGGPNWINTDRWDVEGKVEEGAIPPASGFPDPTRPGVMDLMLQSLIEDRFQLKFHLETRELPVYELTVAKGGPKIKLSSDQTPPRPREKGDPPGPPPQRGAPLPHGSMRMGRGDFEANGWPVPNFIQMLSQQFDRIVVDKTNLKGLYDIHLQWAESKQARADALAPGLDPPLLSEPPSVFTSVQEQLGLKLESAKGPVEVIVIDSVRRPGEN